MLRIKEMPFLGTTNLEISRGGMPPDPPRGRAPLALGFTFTITVPIWNPPIQKSWLRRCDRTRGQVLWCGKPHYASGSHSF